MPEPPRLALFLPESAPTDAVAINARCLVRTQDGLRVVLVAGLPIAHYTGGDAMAEAETALVRRISPHYPRADDEARTLIHSMLANAGDIAVSDTELRVTFAPLSSPHRTTALAALCTDLDTLAPPLRIRFRVRSAPAVPTWRRART